MSDTPSTATSPPAPTRRFVPVPIETTQISSKTNKTPAPRKFAVQPLETTTSSSRKHDRTALDSASTPTLTPTPTSASTPRRFAPQLVETTTASTKSRNNTKDDPPTTSSTRRFAPQLIETSQKSSQKDAAVGKRRFAPQLIETTSSRKDVPPSGQTTPDKPRKFAPVLIATASRSCRAPNSTPKRASRTEDGYALHAQEHRRHITGVKTPSRTIDDRESDFLANARGKSPLHFELAKGMQEHNIIPFDGVRQAHHTKASQRQHSYCFPDLETIESSGSSAQNSSPSSPASSHGRTSPFTPSENSLHGINHVTRKRESIDEGFSRYLLDIEARKVQQRIQEEALLAAFPNSDFHQPVQHYMDNEEDFDVMDYEIEDRPVTYDPDEEITERAPRHRDSTGVNWEQLELREHAEKVQQEANANRALLKKQSESPWWNPSAVLGLEPPSDEMRSMLNRARPPMLGQSLVFPRCQSPEPARFDVTQGCATIREQVGRSSQQPSREQTTERCLWQAQAEAPKGSAQSVGLFKSPASSTVSLKGLWGGFCVADPNKPTGLMVPPAPSGLMTPRPETAESAGNPFEQSFGALSGTPDAASIIIKTPSTPVKHQNNNVANIDSVLNDNRELDDLMASQYPDSFVTQVYNYLSLGYPSLARPFDAELCKITGVSMAELRADDKLTRQTSKGYIRLGPDFEGGGGQGLTEQDCARWRALRLYIREWVRQEKNMVHVDGPLGNWGLGAGARRGSWAI